MATAEGISAKFSRRRVVFLLVGLLALASLPSFLEHVRWFIFGELSVIQGEWTLVALNAGVFLAFVIPLAAGFRWRVNWQSASLGVYSAFVVSLFVEMYGVPLTVYLTSATVSSGAPPAQEVVFSFEVLGVGLLMTPWKIVGTAIIAVGAVLIAWGWATLYRTDQELVTSGIYNYSRHPQYLGFILIVFGWFVHWPSVLTLAMFPVLAYFYYRLSAVEEREVMETIDDEEAYRQYIEETPRFI